jgi:hypothetical protein
MVLLGFSFLLFAHTARPIDVLYAVNFIRSPVNTADSLILIRISFFSSIIMVVMTSVSALSSLLSLVINTVSSALPLPLADMMIVCVRPVAPYTQ